MRGRRWRWPTTRRCCFADEPTGELDEATAAEVFGALRTVNAELGVTVVVVTHDRNVSAQVRRAVAIRDGRTAAEVRRTARAAATAATEVVCEEYAVLDRAGRMQLPAAFVEALALRDRVRLDLEPDHVGGVPARPTAARRRRGRVVAAELVRVDGVSRTSAAATGGARGARRSRSRPRRASWWRCAAGPAPARRRC